MINQTQFIHLFKVFAYEFKKYYFYDISSVFTAYNHSTTFYVTRSWSISHIFTCFIFTMYNSIHIICVLACLSFRLCCSFVHNKFNEKKAVVCLVFFLLIYLFIARQVRLVVIIGVVCLRVPHMYFVFIYLFIMYINCWSIVYVWVFLLFSNVPITNRFSVCLLFR